MGVPKQHVFSAQAEIHKRRAQVWYKMLEFDDACWRLSIGFGGLSLMSNKPIKMGMTPPSIGAFILEEIFEPLNLSISKAAEITRMWRATLSDIVNGKARLSPDAALRLEKAFGVSMALLSRLQTAHDVAKARERSDDINVQRYVPA